MHRLSATMLFALLVPALACFAQPTTTVIAHGFTTGSKGVWVQAMAEAILERAGEGSLYRYEGSTGRWTFVPTAAGDGTHYVVVLIFNWVPESASPGPGPNWNYVQAAGDAMYAMLRRPMYAGQSGPADLVTNRAMHLVGHSRGACVNSETVKRFALANIPIDHYTALDPHPTNGTLDAPYNPNWGDPVPQKWINLIWADNYWRADGGGIINGLDFDGIPMDNVFNTMLNESALNCCAYSFAHLDVHLWYHGTIDISPSPCDGEQCINAQMRNSWWPEGYTQRGYYYSVVGGGSSKRPGPLPPGAVPAPVEIIYNGNFEQGTYAGWGYHGGSVTGKIVLESGIGYLKLGAGQSGASATHNRFFLPPSASAIAFDYRVLTAAANESLRFTLNDVESGLSYDIGSIGVGVAGGWIVNQSLSLDCGVPRGRLYTLTVHIIAPAGVTSIVGVDNIDIAQAAGTGDATGDGLVNVNDLLAVINAWGACASPCLPLCTADVTHDCIVNVNDLLLVINHWGSCP